MSTRMIISTLMIGIGIATEQMSFTDVFQNRCSQKFRKFHRKTPALVSLFDKVGSLCGSFKRH